VPAPHAHGVPEDVAHRAAGMTYSHLPAFSTWLRHNYRPGATYDTDPVAALAADALRRAGRCPLHTPAALVVLLQRHTVTREVYAAAELACARYARTLLAVLIATDTATPIDQRPTGDPA
jgi:hypothetical protein